MQEIEYGRSRLDKIMALDPSLIMDNDFNAFYQTGDWTGAGRYLGGKGWAPKTEAEKLSLVDQMDNQVLEWQQKDPTGKTWPLSVRNYANGKYKFFPEPELPDAPKTINADGRVKQWNGKTGQWEVIGLSEGSLNRAKPSGGGGGGGGGGKEKEPKALTRADLDSISRAVLGGRDVYGGVTQGLVNMLGTAEELDEALVQTYGDIPAALAYARKQAFDNPASKKYYGKHPGAPKPTPVAIDKAKLDKMASDAVNKLGVQGALAQIESSKLSAEEKTYLKAKIQGLAKPKVTVPNLPNVHL